MRFNRICIFLSLLLIGLQSAFALDYSSHNPLYILGKDRNSKEFKEFTQLWHLDKQGESNTKGLKVYVDDRSEKVEGVLFAGESYKSNSALFSRYSSSLPFEVSFTDDTAKLARKLGQPEKMIGRNVLKYNKQNIAIEVAYAGSDNLKIASIKCYHETAKPIATVQTPRESVPVHSPSSEMKRQPLLMASVGKVFDHPEPAKMSAKPVEIDAVTSPQNYSAFKSAIMDVFKAYKESAFYDIKASQRPGNNFWNYKYTYQTKLKIPGEKFNMLYSFPFASSQLDFVSVLKEGDVFDKAFEATYHDFEKKLKENFPVKDGWIVSSIPNKESKTISDLELRNDRYGAVVLDYCRNPHGKHIVYLRFLLFSN